MVSVLSSTSRWRMGGSHQTPLTKNIILSHQTRELLVYCRLDPQQLTLVQINTKVTH